MAKKFVHLGSSIECLASSVVSRKIVKGAFIEIDKIGRCLTYKCKRNSEAHITKELDSDPQTNLKKPLKNKNSKLDLGDYLEAEDIVVYVNKITGYKIEKGTKSGRHNAQYMDSKCYTYSEITQPFSNIPSARIENSTVLLAAIPSDTKTNI